MSSGNAIIARLGLDTGDFRRGLQGAARDADNFGNKIRLGFRSVAGSLGITLGAATLLEFGRSAISAAAAAETMATSFRVLTGDAETAKTVMAGLTSFAAETPFELTELADAGKKLLAFGSSAKEVVPTLRVLGDISSGVGAPIGEIAELFGKARVQGRLFAQDINQLTGRGIPVIQEFAKQFGVADSEVRDLVESGRIGFPQLERALQALTAEGGKFFGMMEQQSQTASGRLSTLRDEFNGFLRDLGAQIKPATDAGIDIGTAIVRGMRMPLEEFVERYSLAGLWKAAGKAGGDKTPVQLMGEWHERETARSELQFGKREGLGFKRRPLTDEERYNAEFLVGQNPAMKNVVKHTPTTTAPPGVAGDVRERIAEEATVAMEKLRQDALLANASSEEAAARAADEEENAQKRLEALAKENAQIEANIQEGADLEERLGKEAEGREAARIQKLADKQQELIEDREALLETEFEVRQRRELAAIARETEARERSVDKIQNKREAAEKRILNQISDPNGAREDRRAKRKGESLRARARRQADLEDRGGRARADVDAQLGDAFEGLKPRGLREFGPQLPLGGLPRTDALKRGMDKAAGNGPQADFKSALDSSSVLGTIATNTGAFNPRAAQ